MLITHKLKSHVYEQASPGWTEDAVEQVPVFVFERKFGEWVWRQKWHFHSTHVQQIWKNTGTERTFVGNCISKLFSCFHAALFDLQHFNFSTVHRSILTLFCHNRTLPSSCVCCSGSVWVWEEGESFWIFSSVMRLSLDWQQELEGFGTSLFSKERHLVERHSNNARTFTSEISWAVWEKKMARESKCYWNTIYIMK